MDPDHERMSEKHRRPDPIVDFDENQAQTERSDSEEQQQANLPSRQVNRNDSSKRETSLHIGTI